MTRKNLNSIFEKREIREELQSIMKSYSHEADYVDIRLGESQGTFVAIGNQKIEQVSRPRAFGGSVRVLYKGGWGFASFNDIESISESVKKAVSFAKMVGRDKSSLVKTKPEVDIVKSSKSRESFKEISLRKKVKLLQKYDNLAWKRGNNIVNVNVLYSDLIKRKLVVTSDGTNIEEEDAYVYSFLEVISRKGNVIQRYHNRLCDTDYNTLLKKEKEVEETVDIVEKLVESPKVKSGIYTVIIDQFLSGTFAHEAFGHLSEADNVYENPDLAKVMKLGGKFGSKILTIVDDPTIPGLRGSYKYDDEGVPATKTILLDKGILVGRLHSRETAGKMHELPTGHSRAADVRTQPLVRMGVTYIEPGISSFKEMIKNIEDGIYCINWLGGETDHERFTFTAGYGIEIKNGKLGGIVRDVKLAGNLFETLKNVDMVGNDLRFDGGNCGKLGQFLPVSSGGPHVRIQKLMVIGG